MARGKQETTALATFDAELAKEAEQYAGQEAGVGGGGSKFSIRGGTLTFNDAPVPNNQMAVVICDNILENVYYGGAFDPDNISSPDCYAFGRDNKTIAPHADIEQPQNDKCGIAGQPGCCPRNEWGSASRGPGKACRNRHRMALIPAGNLDEDGNFEAFENPEDFSKAELAYLGLPPTSLKGFATYVTQLKTNLKRPPFAVFTKVSVVPDAKTQVRVQFELIGPAPDELIQTLMDKNKEAKAMIEFPYQKAEAREEQAPKKTRAPARQAPPKAPTPARQAAAPKAAPPQARAPMASAPKRAAKY